MEKKEKYINVILKESKNQKSISNRDFLVASSGKTLCKGSRYSEKSPDSAL